jgi:hypothetical protein
MDRNLKKGKRGENQRKQTKEKKQQRKTEKWNCQSPRRRRRRREWYLSANEGVAIIPCRIAERFLIRRSGFVDDSALHFVRLAAVR